MIRLFIFWAMALIALSARSQEDSMAKTIETKTFDNSTLMWYKKGAAKWEEALPVGNGRLGAMVFGNTGEERIQLNEDTYWTGGPYSTVTKGGHKFLPEIQQLVFRGEMLKAHNLFGRQLMGYPVEQQKYQSLGNLHLFFKGDTNTSDFKRWLDLRTGITSVEYKANGIKFRRDVFSSAPDQVIVVRITADRPGSVSFTANLRGERNQAHSNYATDYFHMDGVGNNSLQLSGKSADYMGVAGRLRYEGRLLAVPEGGEMSVEGVDLNIKNADAVTLYFAAATNFINYKDLGGDQHERVSRCLENVAKKTYHSIREAHLKDFKTLFGRVMLTLPSSGNSWLSTDERVSLATTGADPQLAALAYHFGRYVLISSSRPGTQASNLQGIWNKDMNPMWDAKYTTNINLQMNYWAVESAALPECAEPLIQLVREVSDQGAEVAREHYGAGGWVLHQNTDIWKVAAPMDGPTWGTFTTGGAWLCTHLWEHYQFSLDTNYLKEVYPLIKGSVQFFMDFLVEDPVSKWLVTNPSTSPENFPASPGNKPYFDEVTAGFREGTTICAGSSIDMQIIADLFDDYTKAAQALALDVPFAERVANARKRLVPPRIGKDKLLQEWAQDWGQLEKKHRHASHMYGLFPGNLFSVSRTPAFAEACRAVLEQRGDEASGWSRAWKTNLWARLHDGNRANKILKGYFKDQANPQLFTAHPMQVDGTLGVTSGISEMLVQSHEGLIELLPALPDEWKEGEFNGVCARKGFSLNMRWKDKRITRVEIDSKKGQTCRIHAGTGVSVKSNNKRVPITVLNDGSIAFPTSAGSRYIVQPSK